MAMLNNQMVKWNDVDLGQETSWWSAESYDDPTAREARDKNGHRND